MKSDLNRSAIDCYEESLSEDVAKKKMRSTALKIEVVNEIIQANNRNKKIKDILDEFKGKSGDHSLKSFLEERLKDDTELKKQILEHQLKEQKYMEDAKNAIIEATRTLQSTNVKVGRAQKDMRFYWADQKCYNGLINYLYDYDNSDNNKCDPQKIEREYGDDDSEITRTTFLREQKLLGVRTERDVDINAYKEKLERAKDELLKENIG